MQKYKLTFSFVFFFSISLNSFIKKDTNFLIKFCLFACLYIRKILKYKNNKYISLYIY